MQTHRAKAAGTLEISAFSPAQGAIQGTETAIRTSLRMQRLLNPLVSVVHNRPVDTNYSTCTITLVRVQSQKEDSNVFNHRAKQYPTL